MGDEQELREELRSLKAKLKFDNPDDSERRKTHLRLAEIRDELAALRRPWKE